MVKNVIKGSFPMSKVFSFRRVIATCAVDKIKIFDNFMIANGKECD